MSPARGKPRVYATGEEDAPLFDVGDLGMVVAASEGERSTAPKAVGWARCPSCTGAGVPNAVHVHDAAARAEVPLVPLLPGGVHLLWKGHDVITGGGTRTPCRATGVALCALPPRDGHLYRPARKGEDGQRVRTPATCRCATPQTDTANHNPKD